MFSLIEQQKRLQLTLINYDLNKMWASHPLINDLRLRIIPRLPRKAIYDPQDLEHQILFRLTTYDPADINDELIEFIIDEQFRIVEHRLGNLDYDLEYLFRGLTGKFLDLNVNDRLELCWQDGELKAKHNYRLFDVEFKTVHDDHIVSLFSNELHYIHQDRPKGDTFGFYFAGDDLPWAIETTEPSVIAKQYKREALLANGIDPNKAVELTRFYTLPGAPTNAISIMDGLVGKYYKQKGMEALFTTTMPMYSKTKSTTIAGGINKPLLVKDLRHKFIPVKIDNKDCYQHVTTIPEDHCEIDVLKTHPNFPTMLVVEVYKKLFGKTTLDPLPILRDGSKVMYIKQRERKQEEEVKLIVDNIPQVLQKIKKVAQYSHTEYIRDIIFGLTGEKQKIRLRAKDNFISTAIDATYKYKVEVKEGIKKEIEETIYKGNE